MKKQNKSKKTKSKQLENAIKNKLEEKGIPKAWMDKHLVVIC
jgi:hypothetical protein